METGGRGKAGSRSGSVPRRGLAHVPYGAHQESAKKMYL